ncbi:WxL domain-containing protein [Enterococcus casseliflavus]|uniref:WxL domain-containing protein n=1 Tax=Enterococcus casseliflavus TaxID=37734 RepID=UPI000EAB9FCB|nr:WxL domain-containing protein [Enterococcus casseliflavus]AYJ46806.1 hypothetical protein D8N35_17575 [Enterococcus casseliflavus]MBS5815989.1 WxL domain-containing protein [Enterococcus casseliflavus]MDU3375009.1 WxL domain-containing protein [Enterococcus casseliflavus]
MPIILRRIMIVLSTTLLTVQVFFMPISIVYAGTTSSQQAEKEIVTDVVDKDSLDSKDQLLEGGNFLEIDSDDYMETVSSTEDFESSTSSDEAINTENDSSDYLVESGRENLIFTIDEDNIKQVAANTSFEIKVSTNQEINRFRLILPASAKFSIAHSYSTKVQELSDRSIIWLIETETVSRNFSIQLEFSESGQFSIEDENGEINADILYVETGEISTRNARININVGTWALFIAVWNNQAYTRMNLLNTINSTGTGNLNRPSGDLLITNNSASMNVEINASNLSLNWTNGVITLQRINLTSVQIVGADLAITNSSTVRTTHSVTSSLTGTLTIRDAGGTSENLISYGYLTVENLSINNGRIATQYPIRVNNTTSVDNHFYIRSDNWDSPALETRSLVKSTSNGFAVWDLGSPNAIHDNHLANRFWRTLTFTLQNNTIVNSSQETFNDETFQLSNSNKISSAYRGTPAVPEEEKEGVVNVVYESENGEILDTDMVTGEIGSEYRIEPKEFEGYRLIEEPENASGIFSEEEITVTFVYAEVLDDSSVPPVDPLDPEVEVDPENKPDLPENQGLLSIDFVSQYNFGIQAISAHDQTYYAQPQRLLNEDGTVNETEERPNYVQISDRRSETERNGWELAVTQKEQFKGENNQVLNGASLSLSNQQVITAQGGTAPGLQSVPCELVPGNRRTLLKAQGNEGTGTWIYRFGDSETAGESVILNVPKGATPEATTYSTTLVWELSAVPDN